NRMHALEARIDTLADMVASQQQMLALRASEPQAAAPGAVAPTAAAAADPTQQAELDAIRRQLKDADAGHRFDAVDRVAKGRYKQLAPDLLAVLKDEDPFVRTRAMQVLGDFGTVEAVPMLMDVLDDPNPIIRKAAAEALVRLTGYDPGFDPRASEAERKKAIKKWRDWAAGNSGK
ncbi:MAG TPA: HEAT repeat domain-containing protein, partial [Planctomycetota bacterium]|nr:HEAT repeat domain-containing protein [Planctomycetota bacterium]